MSKEAVEGFYKKVMKDPGLQEKFKAATTEDAFIKLAVDLGAKNGFSFTAEEARARMSEEAKGGSQLSERQLESVAGGAVSYGGSILCGYCGSQSGTSERTKLAR